jgi:hypothetical protein
VSIVFRLEDISSADLTANATLGTNLSKVGLLFVLGKEAGLVLKYTIQTTMNE